MTDWAVGRYLGILPSVVVTAFLLAVPLWWTQTRLAVGVADGRSVLGWEWLALLLSPFAVLAAEPRLVDFEGRRPRLFDLAGASLAVLGVPAGLLAATLALRTVDGAAFAVHEEFGVVTGFPELYTWVVTSMVLLNAVSFGCVAVITVRFLGSVPGVLAAWGLGLALVALQGIATTRDLVPLQDDPSRWSMGGLVLTAILVVTAMRVWVGRGARR